MNTPEAPIPENSLFYYVNNDDEPVGPFDESGMRSLFVSGDILERTLTARAGAESWSSYIELFPKPVFPMPTMPSKDVAKCVNGSIIAAIAFPNPITIPLAVGALAYGVSRKMKEDKEYSQNNDRLQYDGARDWPIVAGTERNVMRVCKACNSQYRGHTLSEHCKTCYDSYTGVPGSFGYAFSPRGLTTSEGLPNTRWPWTHPRTHHEARRSFVRSVMWNSIFSSPFLAMVFVCLTQPLGSNETYNSRIGYGFFFLFIAALFMRNIYMSFQRLRKFGDTSFIHLVPSDKWWRGQD